MEGGKSESRTKKFDRKRSALRPRMPEKRLQYPHTPCRLFIEQEYRNKYREANPVVGPRYWTKLSKAGTEEWDSMGKEKQALYEENVAKQMEEYTQYIAEEYSVALKEFSGNLRKYINSREQDAAAQGKSYSFVTDEEDTDSESEESAGEEESHSGSEMEEVRP